MARLVLFSLLGLLFLSHSYAQDGSSCQEYNISTNSFCLAMTPYPVFLSGSTTQEDISQNLFRVLNASGAGFGRDIVSQLQKSPLPVPCIAAIRSLVCSVYIPGCNNSVSIWQQSIRSPPCMSSCLDVITACGPAVASVVGANCSAVNATTGESVFMNDTEVRFDPQFNTSIYCTRALRAQDCNLPVFTNDSAPLGFCSVRCEYLLAKKSSVQGVRGFLYFVGWVNLVMNVFVITSYCLDPAKRVFPNILSAFVAANYAVEGLNLALHSMVGSSRVLCQSPGMPNKQGDYWLCGLGGAIYTFTIVGGACWIFLLSGNLVHFVTRGKHVPKWWQIPFHIFGWGLPLTLMIIPLAMKKFTGREPSIVFCSLTDRKIFDAVTIIPYCTLFGLSIIMAIGVIAYLTRKLGRSAVRAQSHLLGFVICLSLFELLHIFNRLYNINFTSAKLVPRYIGWLACEFALKNGLRSENCHRPSASKSFAPVAFALIIQHVGQMSVWVFFGFTRQNIVFWKRMIRDGTIPSTWTTPSPDQGSLKGTSLSVRDSETYVESQ